MTAKDPYELNGQERTLLQHVLETIQFSYQFDKVGSITGSSILLLDEGLDVVAKGTLNFVCKNGSCHQVTGRFELHYAINSRTRITDRLVVPPTAVESLQLTTVPAGEGEPIPIEVTGDSNVLRITVFASAKLDELVRNEVDETLLKAWQMVNDWHFSDEGKRFNKLIAQQRQRHLTQIFQQYQQEQPGT